MGAVIIAISGLVRLCMGCFSSDNAQIGILAQHKESNGDNIALKTDDVSSPMPTSEHETSDSPMSRKPRRLSTANPLSCCQLDRLVRELQRASSMDSAL